MLDDKFESEENLFRAIHHCHWDSEVNSFTSATFKDSTGCSVDRQSDRSIMESTNELLKSKPNAIAVIRLTYEDCKSVEATVKYDPVEKKNLFHSLILDSKGSYPIKSSLAKKLQRLANICFQKSMKI